MSIGDKVKKYLAEKEAASQEDESPIARADRAYVNAGLTPPESAAPVVAPEPTMASVLQIMAAMLQEMRAQGAQPDGAAVKQLEMMEQILVKTKPENVAPPLISHYNPLGDRDHPRPELKCTMTQVGYVLKTDTLSLQEIELLNQLKPGDYLVTKSDGSRIPFKVGAKYDSNLKLDQLDIWYPCKGTDRHNHRDFTEYMLEVLSGAPLPSRAELFAELQTLKAQLAGVAA